MATEHTWIGTTGDFADTSNWNTGEIPGLGDVTPTDTAIYDGSRSNVSCTTNLNRPGADIIKRIITRPNYTGSIGASGNPLSIKLQEDLDSDSRIIHRGSGEFYFRCNDVLGGTAIVDSNSGGQLFVDCNTTLAHMVHIISKNGKVTIASTCSVTNKVILDGSGANVVIEAADSTEDEPTHIICRAGTCTSARNVSGGKNVIALGGKVVLTGLVFDTALLLSSPAGVIEWNTTQTVTASHNPDVFTAGLLNASQGGQSIQVSEHVISGLGNVRVPVNLSWDAWGARIDLREEYP